MTGGLEFKFRAGMDNTEALAKFKELKGQLTGLRDQIKSTVSEVKIHFSANTADIANDIKEIKQLFGKVASQEIKVTADMGDVTAELKQINAGIKQTNQQLENLGSKATEVGKKGSDGIAPLNTGLGALSTSIKGIISGYAGLAGFDLFINTTDQAKQFEGQLKLVTDSQQELLSVNQQLLDMSNSSGTQMASSVELYTKLYNSTRNLDGANSGLLVRVTDITNKLVAIGGSSGESANAAIIQLSQAMAQGQLRGEELNSVMEQTPGLAKGLADGLGVSIGQLRKMAENGELTTDVVINALLKMGKTADEKFAEMPRKAAQAGNALSNELKKAVSDFDKKIGLSASFISLIDDITKNLSEVLDYVGAIGAATGIVMFSRQILIARDALKEKVIALLAARDAEIARTQVQLQATRQTAAQTALELRLAEVELLAATNATQQAAAQARVTEAKIANIQATRALNAAELAANGAMSAGLGIGRTLLGLLGGPIGLVLTIAAVASGFLLMRDNGNEANAVLEKIGTTADETRKKLEGMTVAQAKGLKLDAQKAYDTAYQDTESAARKILNPLLDAIYAANGKVTKDQNAFALQAARGEKTGTQIIEFAKSAGVAGAALDQLTRQAAEFDTALKTEKERQKQVQAIDSAINQKEQTSTTGGVTQKSVAAKVDTQEREKIRLQAAIAAENEFTAQKRNNIIALGNLEIQILEQQKKKSQSDAAGLGKIENQIYEQKLKNKNDLADFDRQALEKNKDAEAAVNDAAMNARKAQINIEIQQLENKYNLEEISLVDYFNKRIELTQRLHKLEAANLDKRINAEIDGNKRAVLIQQREALRISNNEAGLKLENDRDKAAKQIVDQIVEQRKDVLSTLEKFDNQVRELNPDYTLNQELLNIKRESDEAREKVKKLRDELKKLGGEGGTLTVNGVDVDENFLVDLEDKITRAEEGRRDIAILNNKAAEINKETQQIINRQQDQAAAITRARRKNGGWDNLALDKAENTTRDEGVNALTVQRDKLIALKEAGMAGEDIENQIRDINNAIDEMSEKIPTGFQEFSLNIKQTSYEALVSGLGDFFTDIATGAESVGDAAKNMARNFVGAIARMASEALAKMAVFALFRAVTGGLTGGTTPTPGFTEGGFNAAGLQSTISAGVYHTGGIAGSGGTRRNINPADFIGAPKYHVGGVAGLAPGEMPAILKPGEEVLTLDNPRHIANGAKGQQSGTPVKIVNVFTREMALEHLASSEGEKVQLNTIERNSGAIKEMLGLI